MAHPMCERIALSAGTLLVALAVTGSAGPAPAQGQPGRIVAVADIHGSLSGLTQILRAAGIVDGANAWIGGNARLVQTGDFLDRGADVRQVMDLLMRLESEARRGGGSVEVLFGNHEGMNLLHDFRDVAPGAYAAFADRRSDERRRRAFDAHAALARRAGERLEQEAWMAAHPPGYVEYVEALAPRGRYGRWIRSRKVAVQIDGTLFMHAGINPAQPAPRSINEVNDRARAEIRRMDQYRQRLIARKLADPSSTLQQVLDISARELQRASEALAANKADGTPLPEFDVPLLREAQGILDIATWSLVDPDGPMWFRGYALWNEAETTAQVFTLLDSLKLTRVVVGHSVTPDRKITARYNQRVLLIDTGMLTSAYKGTPAALEIRGAALKAIYPSGEVSIP